MKHPSYCCQKCGEQIGWLGRLLWFIHKCKKEANPLSSDALEYFYGITPERLNAMKNTPPPKSTDEAWKEHYRLQEEYIEELEREIDRLKMRILSLEVAGQNVVYQATEMWKHGAIREWMNLTKKEEL